MGDSKASSANPGDDQFSGKDFPKLEPAITEPAASQDRGYERGLWSLFIGDQPERYPRSTRWLGRLIITLLLVISVVAGAVYLGWRVG